MARSDDSDPLPPLEWLRVFEAAGRIGGFTAAAAELGLTQAAVSQRIRNLEGRLETRLFERKPRGVDLTADGQAYLPHVQAALSALSRATTDLFAAPRQRLTIATPASVAQLWLVPRLAAHIASNPDLRIALVTIQRPADYATADAEIEVRFGPGPAPGRIGRRLFAETLAPVAAPGLVAGRDVDWRRLPQIALTGPRDGWRDWAASAGVPPPRPPALRLDTFAQALDAAIAGAGVLLASLPLAGPALAAGRLVRLAEPAVSMEEGYWLTWSARAGLDPRDPILLALCGPAPIAGP